MRDDLLPDVPIDPELSARIEAMFEQAHWAEVTALLEQACGTHLPLITSQGAEGVTRVRCAAVKLSEGSLVKLRRAIEVAQIDWRDVLVAAGFANGITAHRAWLAAGR